MNNPSLREQESNPTVFSYPICDTVRLLAPSNLKPINFWDVINNRRSNRSFQQLSLQQISNLLWVSAKVKNISVQENGYILTQRPNASAGARHPIDIIILSPLLENDCFFYYNPFEHSLNKLLLDDKLIEEFTNHLDAIIKVTNGTIIWFIAHPSRTEAKYNDPLSLIWRDAGTLIHSIEVVCSGFAINSCAVGTLGEPYISKMFSSHGNLFGVGGIIVG